MELFKYNPIDLGKPSFRLLRLLKGDGRDICCEIFDAWLHQRGNVVFYEALSYTWGYNDFAESIEVKGRRLHITLNLYRALRDLRLRDRDRILWVDAICIDQQNKKEQGLQVQQMDYIYKQADQVIFWLGQSTYNTNVLMDSLRELQKESIKHVGNVLISIG
ncbi:heterokaryon incompatibility protein-domain-containing protein [Xylogone sp. PMI_703]|nr:heterokaryon incompatibility protein-domain-containing protein [Xylogone sp. PMI_703]